MIRLPYLLTAFAGMPWIALSQAGPAVDRFEVASIKPSGPTEGVVYFRFYRGGVSAKGASLALLVLSAFDGIRDEGQILNAPKWVFSEKFDIEAKPSTPDIGSSDAKLTSAQQNLAIDKTRARLRVLLEDRFQLSAHTQERAVKGYALVLAKQGAKFLSSRLPDGAPGGVVKAAGPGRLSGPSISPPYLANWIGRSLGAPVADKTGLIGFFNIDLTFTPDSPPETARGETGSGTAADPNGPSLFTALQTQLGLKLVPENHTALLLVIDRVAKPTGN